MNLTAKTAAIALLAVGLVATYANAEGAKPAAKKHVAKKPAAPSVSEQIQSLRQDLESQINSLKTDLANKDAQLKQAQEAATQAQSAAEKAQAAASQEQQAVTENTSAVSTLQGTVTDLKANQVSLATTVSDESANIKKQIGSPDSIHYKGITISPAGSFLAAETTWRSGATASDLNTPFTKIPLQYAANAQLTEFYGSGRQSRIALKATGKLNNVALTGYYEVDWLGAGVTSNSNQSNSYLLRQRQIWLDAKFTNGWDFSAGQGWSLAAETTSGLTRGTEILPGTIDAAYTPGFVWTRQWSARVSKDFGKKFFAGFSLENPEMLDPSPAPASALATAAGTTGGLYNNGNNYSYNLAPDVIAKIAIEPGWGHWEVFGIGRFFRDRIYGCATVSATCTVPTATAPYNSDVALGAGIGGGFRGPLFQKKLVLGLKGLYGQGVGRYGTSTIIDVTTRPDQTLSPVHGFSGLASIDLNPTPRLNIYLNYGGDYANRDFVTVSSSSQYGYGTYTADMSGCNVEASGAATGAGLPVSPGTSKNGCAGNNKDVQAFVAGYWFNFYNGPKGRFRQGIQYSWDRRDLWSGLGVNTTNPAVTNPGGGAYGTENMIFTSFRYYLP